MALASPLSDILAVSFACAHKQRWLWAQEDNAM
jgi:hypothetical protein